MVKRRRERDRPKMGPSAYYDSNKRVLLSYDDDESNDEPNNHCPPVRANTSSCSGSPRPLPDESNFANDDDEALAGYEFDAYITEEEEAEMSPASRELNHDISIAVEGCESHDTHVNVQMSRQQQTASRSTAGASTKKLGRNETTNQIPALGSLSFQYDDGVEEAENDDESSSVHQEAMAYLLSVRSERRGLPDVLRIGTLSDDIASPANVLTNQVDTQDAEVVEEAVIDLSPQAVYTQRLKRRFLQLRKRLQTKQERASVAVLTASQPTDFWFCEARFRRQKWLQLLNTTDPAHEQISSMSQDSAFALLDFIRRTVFCRKVLFTERLSSWIWILLARLDEVGRLHNEQVSALREFGQSASLAPYLDESHDSAIDEELDYVAEEPDVHDAGPAGPSLVDDSSTAQEQPDPWNTAVTIDMILTIIGELYGQRDMLEQRLPWSTG